MRTPTLDAAFETFESAAHVTYSVGWIDGLASGGDIGRSVVFLGETRPRRGFAGRGTGRSVRPGARTGASGSRSTFPRFAMSRTPVRLFNRLYYQANAPGDALCALKPLLLPARFAPRLEPHLWARGVSCNINASCH